jgi:hypothetical protein
MGRITSFSKKVIVFFLVMSLLIRPTFAANVGGWTLGGGVAQGASVVYQGTKQVIIDGKDYIKKGTAIVTPTATGVAKVLARGAAGYALSVAVEQLLGAVDWVLDPANNQIKYWQTDVPVPPNTCAAELNLAYAGVTGSLSTVLSKLKKIQTVRNSGQFAFDSITVTNISCSSTNVTVTYTAIMCTSNCAPSVNYTYGNNERPNRTALFTVVAGVPEKEEPKTIPLETVAQQVISNAESGDTNAQVATTAAAADIVAESESDNVKARPIVQQLEATATTTAADAAAAAQANTATGTQTQNPTKPGALDLKLEFPAFCGWAPVVCEAAQVVISFPQTLTNWWETGKSKAVEWATSISEAWTKVKEEYADKPQENTDTELDIPDLSDESIDTDIAFGGSCPAPLSSDINFMGLNKTIEFSFDPVCQIAEFIKPVVISISAFSAALIVAGIRTEDD